ncbi:hypothetical protein FGG08_002675, partial [Glutinoglossum americanum]
MPIATKGCETKTRMIAPAKPAAASNQHSTIQHTAPSLWSDATPDTMLAPMQMGLDEAAFWGSVPEIFPKPKRRDNGKLDPIILGKIWAMPEPG